MTSHEDPSRRSDVQFLWTRFLSECIVIFVCVVSSNLQSFTVLCQIILVQYIRQQISMLYMYRKFQARDLYRTPEFTFIQEPVTCSLINIEERFYHEIDN